MEMFIYVGFAPRSESVVSCLTLDLICGFLKEFDDATLKFEQLFLYFLKRDGSCQV